MSSENLPFRFSRVPSRRVTLWTRAIEAARFILLSLGYYPRRLGLSLARKLLARWECDGMDLGSAFELSQFITDRRLSRREILQKTACRLRVEQMLIRSAIDHEIKRTTALRTFGPLVSILYENLPRPNLNLYDFLVPTPEVSNPTSPAHTMMLTTLDRASCSIFVPISPQPLMGCVRRPSPLTTTSSESSSSSRSSECVRCYARNKCRRRLFFSSSSSSPPLDRTDHTIDLCSSSPEEDWEEPQGMDGVEVEVDGVESPADYPSPSPSSISTVIISDSDSGLDGDDDNDEQAPPGTPVAAN